MRSHKSQLIVLFLELCTWALPVLFLSSKVSSSSLCTWISTLSWALPRIESLR